MVVYSGRCDRCPVGTETCPRQHSRQATKPGPTPGSLLHVKDAGVSSPSLLRLSGARWARSCSCASDSTYSHLSAAGKHITCCHASVSALQWLHVTCKTKPQVCLHLRDPRPSLPRPAPVPLTSVSFPLALAFLLILEPIWVASAPGPLHLLSLYEDLRERCSVASFLSFGVSSEGLPPRPHLPRHSLTPGPSSFLQALLTVGNRGAH